jgi:hypothetical protein
MTGAYPVQRGRDESKVVELPREDAMGFSTRYCCFTASLEHGEPFGGPFFENDGHIIFMLSGFRNRAVAGLCRASLANSSAFLFSGIPTWLGIQISFTLVLTSLRQQMTWLTAMPLRWTPSV